MYTFDEIEKTDSEIADAIKARWKDRTHTSS